MILTPFRKPKPTPTGLPQGQFQFTLSSDAKSSATVWKDGKMIRTIFGSQPKKVGKNVEWWDGKDDFGALVPNGQYNIKGVTHNLQKQWLGAIGNTSDNYTGENVWRGFEEFCGIAIVGLYGYAACGYQEGMPSSYKFLLTQPGVKLQDFDYPDGTHQEVHIIATDGTTIFRAGVDPFSNYVNISSHNKNVSFISATLASNDSEVLFSSGTSYKCGLGRTYPKALSVVNQANSKITGLAVNNSFVFASRKGLNNLYVLNKSTGAPVQTISIANVNKLACDSDNNLWVHAGTGAEKYTVNGDGTITTTGVTVSGLSDPQAMECKGTELHVVDGGTAQQIKRFNSSGSSIGTFGQAGGFATNENVANDKFYFSDAAGRTHTSGIAFQADGSWWVVDGGNYQLKKYNSSDVYQTKIQYMPHVWSNKVIPGTGGKVRVFIDYLEFEHDPLTPLNTAVQVKNWGYNVPASKDDEFKRLAFVNTFGGKTVAFQKNGSGWEFVLLKDGSGLIETGVLITAAHSQLYPDGTVRRQNAQNSVTNAPQIFSSRPWTWSGDTPVLGTEVEIGRSPNKTISDPLYWGTRDVGYSAGERLSDGSIVSFDPNSDGYGSNMYKLGILKNNEWIVRANIKTASNYIGEFPEVGWHDGGNSVNNAAGRAVVVDDIIWIPYHGENWKLGQTSKVNIFTKNGIPLDQFGTTSWDTANQGESPAGLAGNMFLISVVKVGNDYYVYTGDESVHGGVSVWRISGFNTVEEFSYTMTISQPIASVPSNKINLLEGLSHGGVNMVNGNGWSLNTSYITTNETTKYWRARTGLKSYRKDLAPDIFFEFADEVSKTEAPTRTLPAETISECVFEAIINFDRNYFNTIGGGNNVGQYFEVLDISDKVISRFAGETSLGGAFPITIKGNGVTIVSDDESDIKRTLEHELPLKLTINSSGVTFAYHNYTPITTAILDPTADWTKPRKVRIMFFWTSGLKLQKKFGIKEFYYSRTAGAVTINPQDTFWISADEIKLSRQRFADKKLFYNKNDFKTNSPGIGSRILQMANILVNNYNFDTYKGPTYYTSGSSNVTLSPTDYIRDYSYPEPQNKGSHVHASALVGIWTGDSKYIDAAKAAILDIVAQPIYNFPTWGSTWPGNSTRWNPAQFHDDINPHFAIAQHLFKVARDYALIKNYFSSGEKATIEDVLYRAAKFQVDAVNAKMNDVWTNRNVNTNWHATGYTFKSGMGQKSNKLFDNGPNTTAVSEYINNRREEMLLFGLSVGVILDDDYLIKSAYVFFKEWLKYGCFPHNGNVWPGEMERSKASGFREYGTSYPTVMIHLMFTTAEIIERLKNPDYPSLLSYSTSEGAYGSEGGPKNFYKVAKSVLSLYSNDITLYAGGELLNGILASHNWEFTEDVSLAAHINLYYKDDYFKKSYLRQHTKRSAYDSDPEGSGWFDDYEGPGGGWWDLFMRGQFEGIVNPY